MSRIAADLLALGYVEHRPGTSRLRLAWELYTWSAQVTQARLASSGQDVLDRLSAACRESAFLVVRQGADAVTVAESIAPAAVQVVSWVGRSYPIARSDAGPMLLADLDPAEVDELLRDVPSGPAGLEGLVAEARAAGVSVLDEQTEPETASAAAPVRDFRRRQVAVVVVSAPAARLRPRMQAVAKLVLSAARELSERLGLTE